MVKPQFVVVTARYHRLPKYINPVESEHWSFTLLLNIDLMLSQEMLGASWSPYVHMCYLLHLLSASAGLAPTAPPTCPSSSARCVESTSRGIRAAHRCCVRAANTPSAGTVYKVWMWVPHPAVQLTGTMHETELHSDWLVFSNAGWYLPKALW